jgi:glycine hydroxymethyltransferase
MGKINWQNMAKSSNRESYNKVFTMLKDHNKLFENSIPLIASENILIRLSLNV